MQQPTCTSQPTNTQKKSSPSKSRKFAREIPRRKLNQRGIAVINKNYKSNYPSILPYLLYNEDGIFNRIQGDFYNVKNNQTSNLNIMVGYFKKYTDYKNSLIVLIAKSSSSEGSLQPVSIVVKSTRYGIMKLGELRKSKINLEQERRVYFKEINLENDFDILDKIKDDVITLTIGNQTYTFLNPEITLDDLD